MTKNKPASSSDAEKSTKRPYTAPDLADFVQETTVHFDTKGPRGMRRPTSPSR